MVPYLGTFKTTYVPSKWIEEEEIFLPPYRALSFTNEIDNTDTRFIEAISANYQIPVEEAYIVTLEYTENIQQELAEYGNYELGSIGEFAQEDENGPMNFIPCQAGVASPWLYGLDAIHVHPSNQKTLSTKKQEKKKLSVNTDAKHINISINKRFLHYVTSIAAAIVLFFAFSTPVSENIISTQKATSSDLFFPSNILSESQVKPVLKEKYNENTETGKIEKTEVNNVTKKPQTKVTKDSQTFSVVICCGVPLKNAESYCKDLNGRGIKAVVDNSGRFLRVLVPNFASREDALTMVHSLRKMDKEFSNVWIMEKK